MRHRLLLSCTLLAAALTPLRVMHAQLSIRPIVVMLHDTQRVADFNVKNDSDAAQEVSIDFRFGYLRSDSTGNARMIYDDTTAAREHGMVAWTTAFPRRFVLQPGAEQIVRLSARPPAALGNGVYWTRLVTGSQPLSKPAEVAATGVSPVIIVRLEQITTVLYRHGEVTGGVTIGALQPGTSDSTETQLRLPITRTGTSPFIGQSRLVVKNARGTVVHEARAPIAVYFDFVHKLSVPRAKLAPGSYTAEVRVDNEASDVPTGSLPRIAPTLARLEFIVR